MTGRKKIVIYGAGGLGREVLAVLHALPEWEAAGFYDDGKASGQVINGLPVLGAMAEILSIHQDIHVVIAIGNPQIKKEIASKLAANTCLQVATLIHPHALIQDPDRVEVGRGSIITAGVILTTNIRIGEHVLVNLNTTIGHDVQVGNFVSIMPGVNLAGEVKVGPEVLIGSGANVLNGIQIGGRCTVGAGAVVTKDVPQNQTVVGVPARPITVHTA